MVSKNGFVALPMRIKSNSERSPDEMQCNPGCFWIHPLLPGFCEACPEHVEGLHPGYMSKKACHFFKSHRIEPLP